MFVNSRRISDLPHIPLLTKEGELKGVVINYIN
jgi:hypothetical protein